MAQAMQEAVQNSFSTFSDLARSSMAQTMQIVGQPNRTAQGVTEEAQSGAPLVRGLQDVSREMAERSQQRLQRNFDRLQALARCRSMTDFVEVQSSLLRDNLEQSVEKSRRLAELTIQMADEATKNMTVQAETMAQPLIRAA